MKTAINVKSFFVTFSLLLVVSCNTSELSTKSRKRHISKVEKQIIKDKTGSEDFNSFLEFFKQDTIFQFQRTALPFITRVEIVTINAAGDLKPLIVTSLKKTEWEPALWVSDIPQKIEMKNDSAILIYSDTILYRELISNYTFTNSNGKWYFKTLEIN